MTEQPFLFALGKVLYAVTVIEGEMEVEESELLREEAFKWLGPLLAPVSKAQAWKAMFQFPAAAASKGARPQLVRDFKESLQGLDPGHRQDVKTACQGMLVEMTLAFGNHDQDTRAFLDTLLDVLKDEVA